MTRSLVDAGAGAAVVAPDGPLAGDAETDGPAPGERLDGGRAPGDGGGRDGARVPRNCMAGGTCAGNTRCERACDGHQIYRCACTEGRFFCTGCYDVDGGVPDVGRTATCAGNVSLQGRRCDQSGDVCQYAADGGALLCACGDVGPQRLWICQ